MNFSRDLFQSLGLLENDSVLIDAHLAWQFNILSEEPIRNLKTPVRKSREVQIVSKTVFGFAL